MKVLLITPLFPPATGGSSADYELFSRLISKRDEVEVTIFSNFEGPDLGLTSQAERDSFKNFRVLFGYQRYKFLPIKLFMAILQNVYFFLLG